MAFQTTIHLKDCPYSYSLGENVKNLLCVITLFLKQKLEIMN
ncbi:conserved domain protein [Streptococcus constellatus subsp. pharyngis SK1060 = CCUG 46377]|uniref:Conserved domain protein n=1 Tax=Streptococcus constellatus subsp. pharyngis SK1060 = CCUG 46377 TaxID=1035184 RepID=F9P5J9_STRCV|nr:conserved domain protein [Streptococcus constellatus subsp. pharyngis SK1060 = CCUG 46377]